MKPSSVAVGVMSQREAAKRLGVSFATVAQLERSAITKICKALDLPSPFVQVLDTNGRRVWRVKR